MVQLFPLSHSKSNILNPKSLAARRQVPQRVPHLHRFVENPIEFLPALKLLAGLIFGQSWPLGIDVFPAVVLPLFAMAVRDLSGADHLGGLGVSADLEISKWIHEARTDEATLPAVGRENAQKAQNFAP